MNVPQQKPRPAQPQQQKTDMFKQALALHEQGKLDEAALLYRQMLVINPKDARCWVNLGTLLRQKGQDEASVACTARALELSPGNASYLTNYGNCLMGLDRKDEALAAQEAAYKADPNSTLIRANLAIALREAGRSAEAIPHFDAVCKAKPNDPQPQWERAMSHLEIGNFKQGWEDFKVRWKLGQLKDRNYQAPLWQGENFEGKTIVVHEEQGFGDTILAARFVKKVKERGGRVILQCNPVLHRLFSQLEGVDRIVCFDTLDEPYDYFVPMMTLPGIFEADFTNLPAPSRLFAAPELPRAADHFVKISEGRLRVGIVWSGSTTFSRNNKRAVDASRFLRFANIPGVQLFSLQKGPCEKELAECGAQGLVYEIGPHVNDFADTAAVINQLDLVIMTDSSVAHLTGSLGRPVWNLLCYRPYWLYSPMREDCAWYPSMRYFRQPEPGDWDSVFDEAHAALEKLAAEKLKK